MLRYGLENPLRLRGRVEIIVFNDIDHVNWHMYVDLDKCTVSAWSLRNTSNADATIKLSMAALFKITSSINNVDYRDPTIISQIQFSGDGSLINHVAQSLLSPSKSNKDRLDFATSTLQSAYSINTLERIHQPTELTILDYLNQGCPIIATGLLPIEGQQWTLDKLVEKYGGVVLRVRSADWKETVSEFVDRLCTSGLRSHNAAKMKVYTEGSTLPTEMRSDFLPHRFCLDDFIEPQIWLGSVPTDIPASHLHRDPLDGFLFQIMGRKKLTLFSPDQAEFLYPKKAWNNYQPCWVAPHKPRLDLFPKFAFARPIEVVLHPGELLIQPAGWFHVVHCLDSPTWSVSYFMRH